MTALVKKNQDETIRVMDSVSSGFKGRMLIIEDNEVLCAFLKKTLLNEGYEVEAALHGEYIPKVMKRQTINLVLLDIVLPGKDGIYWLKWLKQYYPAVPVVMMSVKIAPEERLQGLKAGAADYVTKPFHELEVLIRIERLLGKNKSSGDVRECIRFGDCELDTENKCVYKNKVQIALTDLECRLLQLFYLNAGIPLSRDDLMQQAMGINYTPLNRSIDTHINRLRKKIEDVPAKPVFIRTVRGKGYCLHLPE